MSMTMENLGTINMCMDCNVIRVMVDGCKAYYAPDMEEGE